MRLTKELLRNMIEEALDISTTDWNTRPVIIPRSVATKLNVTRMEGADWLEALVGEQWSQISQNRDELWQAKQAFSSAASDALYELAKEYTEKLETGEFSEPRKAEFHPEHPWHDAEEYEAI